MLEPKQKGANKYCQRKSTEQFTTCIRILRKQRCQQRFFCVVKSKGFNLNSIRSAIIANLIKNQKVQMCKYNIDTGIYDNLIHIEMFNMVFPCTKIIELNKSIDRKIILCTYNNSCVPQTGECKVTTINKSIEF